MGNQEILDNCDPFHTSSAFATAEARRCCDEVTGQVSRAYGPSIRLAEVAPVIQEMLLRAFGAVHRQSFKAGQMTVPLPDERVVRNQMMTWAGLPVWVDGVVTTHEANWPLIDANDAASKPPEHPHP